MSFHPQMEYAPARWHRSERRLAEAGEPFRYTPQNQAKFDELVTHYPPEQRKSAIIYALFLVQQQQGYVSGQSMAFVAQQIGCTAADVEDVVSYYTMFYTRPVGRIVINVCRTLSCALLGAERVTEEISTQLGIVPGQTTADGMFTLMEVECLGACDRAPVVMINDDQWQERLQAAEVGRFLEDLRTKGPSAVSGCHLCVEARK